MSWPRAGATSNGEVGELGVVEESEDTLRQLTIQR